MIMYIRTNDTQGLKAAVVNARASLLPKDCPSDYGFYLTEPTVLFFEDHIDNELIGQLDKTLCRFTNDHSVLVKWSEAQHETED